MKNFYLEKQLTSIEKYQKEDILAKSFENLKNYTIARSEKTKMYNFARQHYIFTLGKRIMENLRTHSLVKNDKKLLY